MNLTDKKYTWLYIFHVEMAVSHYRLSFSTKFVCIYGLYMLIKFQSGLVTFPLAGLKLVRVPLLLVCFV